jgi:hypothetical protein
MQTAAPALSGSRAFAGALLILLALFAVGRSALGTRLDSFTIDEPWHVVAGVAYERSGDFALNPEHPPLVKRWVAHFLPDAFVLPSVPPLREKTDERGFVEDVMYVRNDDRAAQWHARLAMWIFHALLLLVLGALLWRAFGAAWALATVAFLAIEPSIAAHLPVVMTDLPLALALGIAAATLGLLLARWTWRWSLALGVALGVALGTKHSALPALAALALLALLGWAWEARRAGSRANLARFAQLAVAGLLAIALLWVQYDGRFAPRSDGSDGFNRPLAGKLEDLRSEPMRAAIGFADRHRLLPRAYLWGLADTVRVGIDGRGDPGTLLWGRFEAGPPPWHAWPSLIASKLPLPLLAMALLGALVVRPSRLSPTARWTLAALLAMGTGHALALAGSGSIYAGVRHALPLVVLLAVLGGALVHRASEAPRRAWRLAAVLPLCVAAAMTASEPRLWEYHNELAGGTAGAYRNFDNEGLDLGQRHHEIVAFGEREIAPTGLPMYRTYFGSDAQSKGLSFVLRRQVESLHDDNVEGVYEGFFLASVRARVPAPHFSYDPAEMLAGIAPVVRIGNAEIWRGRQVQPKTRLIGMYGRIVKYVYSDGGDDWALVAKRAQEIVDAFPQHVPAAIELGNAWLRLGERARARTAYAAPLGQDVLALDAATRSILEGQIALLDSSRVLSEITPLRNRGLE